MYENRKYLIIKIDEINLVDFNLVLKNDINKLRKSIDGTKTFIKWDGDDPEFINNFTYTEGPYNQSEIKEILKGEDWVPPIIEEEIEEI